MCFVCFVQQSKNLIIVILKYNIKQVRVHFVCKQHICISVRTEERMTFKYVCLSSFPKV